VCKRPVADRFLVVAPNPAFGGVPKKEEVWPHPYWRLTGEVEEDPKRKAGKEKGPRSQQEKVSTAEEDQPLKKGRKQQAKRHREKKRHDRQDYLLPHEHSIRLTTTSCLPKLIRLQPHMSL